MSHQALIAIISFLGSLFNCCFIGVEDAVRRPPARAIQADSLRGNPAHFCTTTATVRPSSSSLGPGLCAALRSELQDYANEQSFDLEKARVYLYKELSFGAEGSTARGIWRANPSVEGSPWFDDVLILANIAPDGTPGYALGRLQSFVLLQVARAYVLCCRFTRGKPQCLSPRLHGSIRHTPWWF